MVRERFPLKIECPRCGNMGTTIKEENTGRALELLGRTACLVSVPEGFREQKSWRSRSPTIICLKCGSAQRLTGLMRF